VDSFQLFFSGIFQERDDETELVDFLHKGISEIDQLILDSMHEALYVFRVPGKDVNLKFLPLLRPIT